MSKQKLLMWSDFALTGTGYGTVSRYLIKGLKDQFDIDHLAINYNGEFFDTKELPVQVSAARLGNPSDPYGNDMFKTAYVSGKYDYIWIMNDTFVVHKVGTELLKLKEQLIANNKKVPKIIFYYPVDCNVSTDKAGMLEAADHIVAYCEFGKKKTLEALPHLKSKLSIITHGTDPTAFMKLNKDARTEARKVLLNTEPNEFLWINANRNSSRKDIAKTIYCFSMFKKQVPNSKLYLHTAIRDNQFDLAIAVKDADLTFKDVIFPKDYFPHKPVSINMLNTLYNCADAFITTTLGEGWGLTHIDAMTIGMPIVAPDNTCFPEQLKGRGYIYPCQERFYVDNQGYRPMGRSEDIVKTMMKCYVERNTEAQANLLVNGINYSNSINWSKIQMHWLELFKKVELQKVSNIRKQSL